MRIFEKRKDGGEDSPVDAYFLIEWKSFISIALLKFNKGGRENYHTHAFNALTWFIKGDIVEEDVDGTKYKYRKSIIPKITLKSKNHRVFAKTDSWCFTIRGAWVNKWTEYNKKADITMIYKTGRTLHYKVNGLL